VNRLETAFGDQVTFVHLNVDNPEARETLRQFGIRGRSQYLLVAPDGTILQHWFGPISHKEEAIAAELKAVAGMP